MRFLLNQEKFYTLCELRGWRYPFTDLAKATSYSRSYARRVLLENEKVSEPFMLKYIKAAGVDPTKPSEWASLFIVDLTNDHLPEHQKWNYEKIEGRVPYAHFSSSYTLRKKDDEDMGLDIDQETFEQWLTRQRAGMTVT